MKKIISGYLYRSLKTIELWIFVATILFLSFANTNVERLERQNYLKADCDLTATVEETYRIYDDDVLSLDDKTVTKIDVLLEDITYSALLPLVAIPLFTIFFMGKLFSGGALRNLITCGHSKSRIYSASLLFGSFVTVGFNALSLLSMAAGILIRGYKIPLFLPFLTTFWIYGLLLHLTLMTISVSILFISEKPMISLIAVVGIVILLFTGTAGVTMASLLVPERRLEFQKIKEYKDQHPDCVIELDYSFDVKDFSDIYQFTIDGEPMDEDIYLGKPEHSHIKGPARKFLIATLYANPACGAILGTLILSNYKIWSYGLYPVFCLSNVAWIAVTGTAGYVVFRRKELS